MLIAMAGLPGSGKSTVADLVGAQLGIPVVSVDPIESAILSAGIDSDQPTGLAAYLVAERLASSVLSAGQSIIVDAVNAVEPAREQWVKLAARKGVPLRFIEVRCSDPEVHRQRLEARGRNIPHLTEPTWHAVEQSLDEYAEWGGDSGAVARITIDSMEPLETSVAHAVAFLRSQGHDLLILLPPSETKVDGGTDGTSLDLASLRFPSLTPQRRTTLAALRRLSRSIGDSTRALGLGPTQRFEIDRNRAIGSSPTMPAMDRFTGVLFDALDAGTLPDEARAWLAASVVIQSALLGPVGAADHVPAYRLSADSRLPGMSLKRHWASAVAETLQIHEGPILDLRSEGYAALGPVPLRDDVRYLRVVTEGPGGTRAALNHFNKKGKGALVRELALAGESHASIDALLAWAATRGIRLEEAGDGRELYLIV